MMLRNEIFAHVLDWLIKNKYVEDQKDLARKTGITPTTISRIMTGKVEPKDETLRKLNEAFDNIFNMQYLRGRSTTMLAKDVIYYEQHPEENPMIASEPDTYPYQPIPSWASNLIEILSQQIKENEALHRDLRHSIQEVNQLKKDLLNCLQTIQK